MPEVTPVIFDFKAKVNGYLSDVRRTTATVDQQLGLQEKRVRRLEAEFSRSSASIGGTLKGLAGTLAAAFTGREIIGLADSFTRLRNQLKVAGLEGENLASVQQRLFNLGAKYGVSVNSLAELYGKASQAGKELGSTQDELLSLTEAVSQSLLITGTSTEQASGAILGLSQALASGTVRAEEFNQINEGGLRPLLEAAAASERFGGSVAKLRAAVIDGTVSSQELYRATLANADLISGKASSATLTLTGAFQALRDQLAKYIGETGQATGVTATVADAIKGLADNVDVLIPALAVLATAMGVQTVASAAAGSRALFAFTAVMGGAATASEGLTYAMNGLKGALPLAVIAGLIAATGILISRFREADVAAENARQAIDAQGEALGTTGQKAREAAAASDTLNSKQRETLRGVAALTGEVDGLSTAWGRVAASAKDAALQQARATLDAAKSNLLAARITSNVRNEAFNRVADRPFAERGMGGMLLPNNPREAIAAADAAAKADPQQAKLEQQAQANIREAQRQYDEVKNRRLSGFRESPSAASAAKTGTTKGVSKGTASGPSGVDIERRFQSELAGYAQQALSAMQALATNADERAELELRGVEIARIRTLAEIDADKDYDATQKQRLKQQVEALADLEREGIERARRAQTERDAADLAEERFRGDQEALGLQYDLAETDGHRQRIALQILAAEDAYLKSKLEAVIASQTTTDAEKERASLALAALEANSGARREATMRNNETPVQRYMRELNKSPEQLNEALDAIKLDGLDALNDGLTETIMGAKSLGDVFSDVAKSIVADLLRIAIQQAVIQPLAASLFGGGGGASGLVGSIFAGIGLSGKRAMGGPVAAGGNYLVGEKGPEIVRMGGSGFVIPNDALRAPRQPQGGGTVRIIVEEGPNFMSTMRAEAAGVALELHKVTGPQTAKAATAETLRILGRPKL